MMLKMEKQTDFLSIYNEIYDLIVNMNVCSIFKFFKYLQKTMFVYDIFSDLSGFPAKAGHTRDEHKVRTYF